MGLAISVQSTVQRRSLPSTLRRGGRDPRDGRRRVDGLDRAIITSYLYSISQRHFISAWSLWIRCRSGTPDCRASQSFMSQRARKIVRSNVIAARRASDAVGRGTQVTER